MHGKRRHRTEHTGPSPENAVGKTFSFHEPLIKVEDEGVIDQGPSYVMEETLREDKMNDMGGKCAQTYYRDLLSLSRPAIRGTSR